MHKGSDLIGKVIVTYDTGERVERVLDLLFDQDSNQLLGILVDEGGWLSGARVVTLQNVQAIGPSAVVIPSKSAIAKSKKIPEIKQILKRNNVLKGTRIMTTDGRDLGTMVDLYFSEKTGAVEGYEVSGGLFADIYSGRSFVPAPRTLNIGEDVAFVPPEIADMMEEQVGGVKGAVQTTGGKLQETTELAGQRLQDTTQAAGARLQVGAQLTSTRIQEVMRTTIASSMNSITDPTEQKLFVIGKIADQDVSAPDGTPLVLRGQQVKSLTAEAAEKQGVLDQLYQAVGGRFAKDLSLRLQAATESARQKLQETAQTSGERLQQGTDFARARNQEITRSAVTSLMNSITDPAEQKLFISGKIADQDVVAPDGTILLVKGQQATLLAAEEAERRGVLNQLYRAAGGSFAEELSRKLQETTESSSQRLHEFSRSSAASLTDTLVDPAQQKAFVVGKTANQAVVAPNSLMIVAQGEPVNLLMAEEAEQLGVLNQLYRATGGSSTASIGQTAGSFFASSVLDQAVGRRIQQIVRTANGSIIGAPGQIVTEQMVQQAKTYHIEQELIAAVGLTTSEAIRSSTSNALSETGVQLRRSTVRAREQADSLLAILKEKIEELQERTAQAIEKRRIKQALGRPATRVILDKQDGVILNVSELITHQAIELARQAGVLDILLSSVYVKQPELSNTELRGPEPGEARLRGSDQPTTSL